MTSTPLRIVIADAIFREGLKALLRARNDMNVVGDVARLDDLPQMLRSTPCDVLLLDLQMERSALAVLQDIGAAGWRSGVVLP